MNRLFFSFALFYQFSLQAKIIGLKYCYIFRMRGEIWEILGKIKS